MRGGWELMTVPFAPCTPSNTMNTCVSARLTVAPVASRRQASSTTAPAAARPLASSAFKAGAAPAFFGSSAHLRSAAPRGSVSSRAPRQVTTCAAKGAPLNPARSPAQALLHPNCPICPPSASPGRVLHRSTAVHVSAIVPAPPCRCQLTAAALRVQSAEPWEFAIERRHSGVRSGLGRRGSP